MHIGCVETDTGIELSIDSRAFRLNFPREIWQPFSDKGLFADNYAFLKALHLPQMLNRWERVDFQTSYPLFKHQIQSALLNNIPFCADVDGGSAAENIRKFLSLDFRFKDHDTRYPSPGVPLAEKAVLNMSFGKDSLLTYAVAREIGLPTTLVMSVDNDSPLECKYKNDIARRFAEEFGEKIWLVENNTGVIHRYEFWGAPHTEWGFGHLITEYFLNTIPFAFQHGARYILLGNEKSCDDSYLGKEGYRCYPVYDQSSEWMLELTKMARALANAQMKVMSLIEPLHDLAITRVLHTRYPEIGKYQMSCFPDENEYGKSHFWCGHCSKCARVYAYLKAHGIDAGRVGLVTEMFRSEFEDLYSVFSTQRKKKKTVGYDATPCGRDEQLLALYMALHRGEQGALIDLFRDRHLEEAQARNTELSGKFLTIHESRSLPAVYMAKVRAIYEETLNA